MSSSTLTAEEKFAGCLLGGAIGDALGAPIEFLSLDRIREQFGEKGVTDFHPVYGKLGAITDDTQMTLFTAEGVLRGLVRARARGIGSAQVAIVHGSYLRWLKTQVSDYDPERALGDGWLIGHEALWSARAPGNTCLSSLEACRNLTGSPASNDSKGCGTVMRVAPIGFVYDDDLAYRLGKETSALTHGHPTASIAAGALCIIISQLKNDTSLDVAVAAALEVVQADEMALGVPGETSQAIEQAVALAQSGDDPSPELVESLGAAWIAEEALAISIYCALVARDFSHGVLLAVNHGGDSDSTGAITGNLLGLIFGCEQIPPGWRQAVELNELIVQVARDLVEIPANYFPDDEDRRAYCADVLRRYPAR